MNYRFRRLVAFIALESCSPVASTEGKRLAVRYLVCGGCDIDLDKPQRCQRQISTSVY